MDAHTYIGTDPDETPIALSLSERLRHVAVFGATGVGKSTLLRHIVQQDVDRGEGVLFIDPHGDDAELLIDNIPQRRSNQVCYFDLTDRDFPVGFNVLEDVEPDDRATLAENIVSAMRGIWRESWGNRMERLLRHSAAALIETPNASLVLLPRLLTDADFRKRIVGRVSNPITRGFFEQQYDVWRENFRDEVIVSLLNDIEAFTFSPAIRHVIGQGRSTLHFEQAMQRSRIVILNCAKGIIGETPAFLIGALVLARVQAAGMARARLKPDQRPPFHIIIDEAQNFGPAVIASLVTEARKFGLSVTLATQYLSGIDQKVRDALLNSVKTLIVFQVGDKDAELLAPEFDRAQQTFNPYALRQLALGQAMIRISSRGTSRVDIAPPEPPSGRAEVVRKQSRIHYGMPRAEVEACINKLLSKPV
jgi:GTPase SAR1 family protein